MLYRVALLIVWFPIILLQNYVTRINPGWRRAPVSFRWLNMDSVQAVSLLTAKHGVRSGVEPSTHCLYMFAFNTFSLCRDHSAASIDLDIFRVFRAHIADLDPTSASLTDTTRDQLRKATASCPEMQMLEHYSYMDGHQVKYTYSPSSNHSGTLEMSLVSQKASS